MNTNPATARLLSRPTNYAVVHLPGRTFPGVVFQGDSLHFLCTLAEELSKKLEKLASEELSSDIEEIILGLSGPLGAYEKVLKEKGIDLPY